MSVDHNAYIGPYLRVTETLKKISIDDCAGHNFPEDASFCPKCGKSKKERIRIYLDNGTPDDWNIGYKRKNEKKTSGGLHDYLCSTFIMSPPIIQKVDDKMIRTEFYLPNRYYEELGIPKIDGSRYSKEEIPFDELDVKGITQKFLELYVEEIAYLKQWFEVEVKFGYISYCS
jgi:hypothetical protein